MLRKIAAMPSFMNTICSGNQGGEHCNVEAESGALNCDRFITFISYK